MKSTWLTSKLASILEIGPEFTKAAFFFNARGHVLERGAASMLKGLLYQLLQKNKALYRLLLQDLRQCLTGPPSKAPESIHWDHKTLTSMMLKLIAKSTGMRIILFIDALDESTDEDRDVVISLLEQIVPASQKSGLVLDVIFSSRPDATIDISRCRYICLEDENHRDITLYIEKELVSRANRRREINRHNELAHRVMEKADGVFLWVYLVVPRLRRQINRGDTLRKLLQVLEDIPTPLEELFKDILMRIGSDYLPETMRMMQLAVLTERPLGLEELRHALAFGPDCTHGSFEEWQRSEDYVEDGEQMRQRVQSRSGGLLEVRADYEGRPYEQSEDASELQMHDLGRTVSSESSAAGGDLDSHYKIREGKEPDWLLANTQSQMSCLKSQREYPHRGQQIRSSLERSQFGGDNIGTTPFMEDKPAKAGQKRDRFSLSQGRVCLIHETAETYFLKGEGFPELMSMIQSKCENVSDSLLYHSPSGCYKTGGHDYIVKSCLRYFQIREMGWAWSKLARDSITLTPQQRMLFPFAQYVLESWPYHISQAEQGGISQVYVPQFIINHLPNSVDRLIVLAAERNLLTWLSWFKDDKIVDFDTPSYYYGQPIQRAVARGHIDAVKILVQGGANVNGTTGGFKTTLSTAISNRDNEMIEYLYVNGATMSQPHWLPLRDFAVRIRPPYRLFCHYCEYEWDKLESVKMDCPKCESSFTEVLD
jgi:hypothetical protein